MIVGKRHRSCQSRIMYIDCIRIGRQELENDVDKKYIVFDGAGSSLQTYEESHCAVASDLSTG